ncbi:RNA-binding protein NOB1 [Copidosoma floridanum]|uniref:RNA-binding protein NOB1 n=1 Tax=Copidosoma floridanum TaxID=29053 RepID=UPI0006C96D24|nr:RNA-binding protein NOB1 [Copidosoma floridanum]
MSSESKVEYLIVDTSAFIKNAALQDIGNKIITEPGVVSEIKSKRQLRRLVVLPYDLEVKEASPEDIKFVTAFSKKTGDYPSLSATDIKVIALTYRYEKERVGSDHLRKEPLVNKEIVDSSIKKPEDHNQLLGFYMPDKDGDDQENDCEESDEETSESEDKEKVCENKTEKLNPDKARRNVMNIEMKKNEESNVESDELVTASDMTDESCGTSDNEEYDTAPSDEENKKIDDLSEKFRKLDCDPEGLKLECENDFTIDDILKAIKDDTNKVDEGIHDSESENEDDEEEEEDYDEDSDDNSEWITPRNLKDVRKKMDSGVIKEKPATVACLTMDYAMQNVLMQIGLNVASLEGKVIKQMRTFILRCYLCFKTTGIATKVFCPKCGNKSLKKVAVSLNDEGKQIIHINFKKPLSSRGKKFSLPTFKGGKHACNPILSEDQPRPDQRPTKLGRTKNDPLNEDYTAGYSPFVMRDVNSRAAMLGIKPGDPIKYWMRRNPNEPRKHKK